MLGAFALVFVLIGVFFVRSTYGNWRAAQVLGDVEVTVGPGQGPEGASLTVTAKVASNLGLRRTCSPGLRTAASE